MFSTAEVADRDPGAMGVFVSKGGGGAGKGSAVVIVSWCIWRDLCEARELSGEREAGVYCAGVGRR